MERYSNAFEPNKVYVESVVTRLFQSAAKYQSQSGAIADALGEALERIGWELGEEFGLSARRIATIGKECGLC